MDETRSVRTIGPVLVVAPVDGTEPVPDHPVIVYPATFLTEAVIVARHKKIFVPTDGEGEPRTEATVSEYARVSMGKTPEATSCV